MRTGTCVILTEILRESHRSDLVNIGRLEGFTQADIDAVAKIVTEKSKGTPDSMFEKVLTLACEFYSQLIARQLTDLQGGIASGEKSIENLRQQHEQRCIVRISTLKYTGVRRLVQYLCHETIKASLTKKCGTKKTDKVMERLGRAKQKYPSVSSHYELTYTEEYGIVISLVCS